MGRFKRTAVAAAAACLLAGGARAAGTTGAEFLLTEVPARSAALAAGTAGQGDSQQLAWNPAGILGQTQPALAFTHLASLVDTAYEQLEGLYPDWLGGAWAGQFFYASTYNFMEINEFGEEVGALENYDLLAAVTHARDLGAGLSAGLTAKYFTSLLAGYSSQGGAVDLGLQFKLPGLPVRLGAALRNLGAMTAFETEADPLPLRLLAGIGWEWLPGEGHAVNVLADFQQPLTGAEDRAVAAGLEYMYQSLVSVRAGYRVLDELGSLSLGAGVRFGGFGLDYAYQPFDGLGDNHRFTLSYYFPEQAGPSPRDLEAAAPEAEGAAIKLRVAQATQAQPKRLTVLPQQFEGRLAFKPPEFAAKARDWRFEIRNHEGQVVKTFSSAGLPPDSLAWDGRNEAGNLLPAKDSYQVVFIAGKTETARQLPQLEPPLKLQFSDGAEIEPGVRFAFNLRPPVQRWSLRIRERGGKAEVRALQAEGELPEELFWDGLSGQGKVADTRLKYSYELAVAYPDGSEAVVAGDIRAVAARRVEASEGEAGVLIYGILFDFNSAVLDAAMTDKCLAAAELLRRHPGQARAVSEGHADEIGTVTANLKLSRERALMVANFLADQRDASRDAISVAGFGKSRPEARGRSENARARNRRVEVRVFVPQPRPALPKAPTP
ncbi:MAG: PorV/PorQ family protein [candidate division FCPU426 bacterium]